MENKQQTAVDWLYEKLSTASSDELVGNINTWFIQAKEMEKQQHTETWLESRIESKGGDYIGIEKTFEEYYNERYGNEQRSK